MRYALRAGECLAIDPGVICHDSAGFYIMMGPEAPENERRGTVCIVHVRGALAQFKGCGGDSYEAIIERVQCGLEADPKPSVVMFCHSSPGGVVAGLNETVTKLQRMSADSGVPFVSFVGEISASADYALCCGSGKILAPPSGIVGSIGTISTMVSCAEADKKEGLDFRLITSGKRKADGHPHAVITDDAVKAETARNSELAAQFCKLASKARRIPAKELAALEAAIYLAADAEKLGLIDEIVSFDEAVYGLDRSETPPPPAPAPNNGNQTDRRAKELDKLNVPSSTLTLEAAPSRGAPLRRETPMSVKLSALIKKTEAAISTEKDPKKLRSLQASLAAFQATKAEMDDDDDGDKGDDDGEDKSKSEEAAKKAAKAKKAAEAAKHRAKAAEHKQKAAEYEEAAKSAEEDDEEDDDESEEEASARIAEVHAKIEGSTAAALAPGAAAAVASQTTEMAAQRKRLDKLEAEATARTHSALVEEARAARRITPREATMLAKKPLAFVRDFLEMRPKALVNVDDDATETPDRTPAGDIPAAVKAIVEQAVVAAGLTGEKADKFREESYAAQRKAASNGAGVTH